MAGWIKMPLGKEVDLGPGNIVKWQPRSPTKKILPPIFGLCLLWPNGWMDQDTTWHGGKPRPRQHCVRWGPPKGHTTSQILAHVLCGQTAG